MYFMEPSEYIANIQKYALSFFMIGYKTILPAHMILNIFSEKNIVISSQRQLTQLVFHIS